MMSQKIKNTVLKKVVIRPSNSVNACTRVKHVHTKLFTNVHGIIIHNSFPCGSAGKECTCHAGDLGSMPGLGRSPGGGRGNPRQYSCLENPMDRGAWQATVLGVAKGWTQLKGLGTAHTH